ncbi:Aste57867_12244 [Aphanomyces stellatus]|uniref:Aste57867_12244 protein n=1 Tax=Aphanomyces stellatus TaxID=120398 RepID=A0A485KV15_9STRA|nr:hypothetical protein As57867_012199 [Aphanomyces stellatus]VFT89098.1 Aste57867_12244 [Aphanomyces stellatus]
MKSKNQAPSRRGRQLPGDAVPVVVSKVLNATSFKTTLPSKNASNNQVVVATKPRPTASKKAALNQKLNRTNDRAVIHAFRHAFLALNVTQVVRAHGAAVAVVCSETAQDAVFVALTSYTVPLALEATPLKQVLAFESLARSSVTPSTELASRLSLKPSGWRLVDQTTDGTALGIYQYMHDVDASSVPMTLLAVVWLDGLVLQSLYALYSIPAVASSLLARVALPLTDDVDPRFGLTGYSIAVTLRSLDHTMWTHEAYSVDFAAPVKAGATETSVVLLDRHGALRERSRIVQPPTSVAIRTLAFHTTATKCVVVDVALWDFEHTLRWATSQCVAWTPCRAQPETIDMDFGTTPAAAMELRYVHPVHGRVHVELTPCKAKTIVSRLEVALSLTFINATFGTSY